MDYINFKDDLEISVTIPNTYNINRFFLFLYDSGFCYNTYRRIWIEDVVINTESLTRVINKDENK